MVTDYQKKNSKPISRFARFLRQLMVGRRLSSHSEADVGPIMDVCELENRILYSGSPLPVEMMMDSGNPEAEVACGALVDDAILKDNPFEIQGNVFELEGLTELSCIGEVDSLTVNSTQTEVEQLIFIDSGIESFDTMLIDLQNRLEDAGNTKVIVIDDVDGVEQITETLLQHQNLQALHLVTHGRDGAIELGNGVLSNENIASYAGEIASWKNALSESADILFYGCNLGSGPEGLEFLEMMTELTDAEVAGSDDVTGHASLMGNWVLEINTGRIDTEFVFSESIQDSWTHTLAMREALAKRDPLANAVSDEPVLRSSQTLRDIPEETFPNKFRSRLKIQEGATVTLKSADFKYNRPVSNTNSQYTVSNVEGGHFAFAAEPELSVSHFTQQEVKGGLVVFVDDGDDVAPSYDISVLNPAFNHLLSTSGAIRFLPVNDPAVINLGTTQFSLDQNSAPIAIDGITVSDSDGETGIIEVTVSVESGSVDLVAATGVSVTADGKSRLIIVGEIESVSKSLNTLTYQPNADFRGLDTLEIQWVDQAAESTKLSASQTLTASLDVQGTDVDVSDEPDFEIHEPTEITIDGTGNQRRVEVDLHQLFHCAGNAISHPEPDFAVVEVTDPCLFRKITVTDQDTVLLVARAAAEGTATVTISVTHPDGSVGEATLIVNVESSKGEVLDDPRAEKEGYHNWYQRLMPAGGGHRSDVMVVSSPPCSEMSLVVVETAVAEKSQDESDLQGNSQDPPQQIEGGQDVSQAGPAPISELIRSASEASWLNAREFGEATERSELNLAKYDFDFSSNLDYQDPTSETEINYLRFQIQTASNNLNPLSAAPVAEVLEASSPLAFAALDDYSENLSEAANHFGVAVAGSLISLSGLSIGVVTWVARNSAIVTSLMANMPTWQLIDPLVVLGGENDLNSGESVIDIISASETVDNTSRFPSPH